MPKQYVEHGVESTEDETIASSVNTEAGDSHLLQTLSREGRMDDVAAFAEAHGLLHQIETFEKAAALLQSDCLIEDVPGITDVELEALQLETERKWRQPKMLYFVVTMCSLAAIEQG